MIHELKTDSEVFEMSWNGIKDYEIRFNDRNFKPFQDILLRETVYSGEEMKGGMPLEYTGRAIGGRINSIIENRYGLMPGWCILNVNLHTFNKNYREEI
jgi:hypothetical protein